MNFTTAATLVLTCVLHITEKKDKKVLYVFWVCMGANPVCLINGNKKDASPHAVL